MKKLEIEIAGLVRAIHDKTGKYLTIGTVESATGGRIADRITNVAGSSDYFKGAIVAYSNEIKIVAAGVKEETLKSHGAVSHETAMEMAQGGRRLLQVDICLSTTGIAGPGGATPVKPVGLFYMGLSTTDAITQQKHLFTGNRDAIKHKATEMALKILQDYLQKNLAETASVPLEEKRVVTCFLEHRKMILIMRRSSKVGTYQRAWAGVSGYIETDPLDQAYTEIREETGLFKNNIKLITQGKPLEVIDKILHRKWVVHPFLFHVLDPEKIMTNWEHTECKWIRPEELSKFKTVPGLAKALSEVLH